jgi:hypothetical protein
MEGVDVKSAAHLLSRKIAFERGCDELEARFYMHVDGLRPKWCSWFAGAEFVTVVHGVNMAFWSSQTRLPEKVRTGRQRSDWC